MELPTVKSFCYMNVKTAGQVLGFIQLFIFGSAILFNLYFRGHLLLPIILMPIFTNICWIYGIREKKPKLMLPAMIPFVIASLVCICFITIYPIGIAFLQPAFVRSHNMCTDFSYSYYGGFQSKECVSTKRDHFIDTDTSGAMLGVWIVGCAISYATMYLTIVLYSAYKSVEEEFKRNHLHLPTSDSN